MNDTEKLGCTLYHLDVHIDVPMALAVSDKRFSCLNEDDKQYYINELNDSFDRYDLYGLYDK